jgi:hypothetical protein
MEPSILPNVVHERLQVELCIDTHDEEGKKSLCLQRCTNRKSIFMMAFERFNGPSTPNGNYTVIRLYNNVNLRSVGQFKFIGVNHYLGQYLFQKKFRIF